MKLSISIRGGHITNWINFINSTLNDITINNRNITRSLTIEPSIPLPPNLVYCSSYTHKRRPCNGTNPRLTSEKNAAFRAKIIPDALREWIIKK
jgi:hypothetical protein